MSVLRMVWTEQNGSHICILVTENTGSGTSLPACLSLFPSLTLAISVTLSQLLILSCLPPQSPYL